MGEGGEGILYLGSCVCTLDAMGLWLPSTTARIRVSSREGTTGMSDGWRGEWSRKIRARNYGGAYASTLTTPASTSHAMSSAHHGCDDFRIYKWGGGGFSRIELVMPRKNRGILSVIGLSRIGRWLKGGTSCQGQVEGKMANQALNEVSSRA